MRYEVGGRKYEVGSKKILYFVPHTSYFLLHLIEKPGNFTRRAFFFFLRSILLAIAFYVFHYHIS
jgi:hypothetical protein